MPKPDDVFIGCYFKKKLVQKCFFPIMTKLEMSKNVNNRKAAPKLIFFNEKKIEKDSDNF